MHSLSDGSTLRNAQSSRSLVHCRSGASELSLLLEANSRSSARQCASGASEVTRLKLMLRSVSACIEMHAGRACNRLCESERTSMRHRRCARTSSAHNAQVAAWGAAVSKVRLMGEWGEGGAGREGERRRAELGLHAERARPAIRRDGSEHLCTCARAPVARAHPHGGTHVNDAEVAEHELANILNAVLA